MKVLEVAILADNIKHYQIIFNHHEIKSMIIVSVKQEVKSAGHLSKRCCWHDRNYCWWRSVAWLHYWFHNIFNFHFSFCFFLLLFHLHFLFLDKYFFIMRYFWLTEESILYLIDFNNRNLNIFNLHSGKAYLWGNNFQLVISPCYSVTKLIQNDLELIISASESIFKHTVYPHVYFLSLKCRQPFDILSSNWCWSKTTLINLEMAPLFYWFVRGISEYLFSFNIVLSCE